MRVKLFQVGDLKIFLPGAAVAVTAGLLLGGAVQPHLDAGDGRPAGPQSVAGWETGRSTGPFDPGVTLAAYHGQMPDYVLGTDWKKTMAWPDDDDERTERQMRALLPRFSRHGAADAYDLFLTLCVERTKGGLPPYSGMPEDLRRLAKAAHLSVPEQDTALLRAVLDACQTVNIPKVDLVTEPERKP